MNSPTAGPADESVAGPAQQSEDHIGLDRLVFFSDAVFAIAATLLALEIRLPVSVGTLTNEELTQELLSLGPKYFGFVLSFLIIGVFWIGHHRRYRSIVRFDETLLFLNLILLMIVAFIPFPTSVLSEHGNRTGTIFYAGTMAAAGLLAAVIWAYASRHHHLLRPQVTPHQIRRDMARLLVVPIIFGLSIVVAFIDTDLAKFTWILVAPAMVLIR